MEDVFLINLKYVVECLMNEDDTTKAAGHRLYDIKADHIM